jgi:hypothetical protein
MISNDKQMDLFTTERNADGLQVNGTHYKDMEMQPWTVMECVLSKEEFVGFLKGNIIKYAMRQGKKDGSDDAGKARHYKQKLNEVLWHKHLNQK